MKEFDFDMTETDEDEKQEEKEGEEKNAVEDPLKDFSPKTQPSSQESDLVNSQYQFPIRTNDESQEDALPQTQVLFGSQDAAEHPAKKPKPESAELVEDEVKRKYFSKEGR